MEHQPHQSVAQELAERPGGKCGKRPTQYPNHYALGNNDEPHSRRPCADGAYNAILPAAFHNVKAHGGCEPQAANYHDDARHHYQEHVDHQQVLVDADSSINLAAAARNAYAFLLQIAFKIAFDGVDG